MTTPLLHIIAFSLATLTLPAFAATTIPSDGGLAAKIQPFVDQGVIPGAVLLVADKDKVLDLEAVGYSDYDKKTPMTPDALFMVCSMTKTVTSAGLMMLVDQGKISLDDPVEKYLPAFKGQMVDDPKNPGHPHPPQHPITIRECMSHTAGLHEKLALKAAKTVVEAANQFGQATLDWEPGSQYHYSAGPLVAGAVIEVVSGMPYTDYIKKYVLDPLGMTDSSFFPDASLGERLAITGQFNLADNKLEDHGKDSPFFKDPSKCGPVPLRVASQTPGGSVWNYTHDVARPDGDLFSTALDFAKFSQMLLNHGTYQGKTYLSPAAVKEMSTIQTKDHYPGNTEGYGLGTFIQKNPSDDGPSPGSFGHRGARKTVFWVDPADNLILVFMTQKWDLKKEEQKGLNAAFFKTAIEKYGTKPPQTATTN